EDAATRQAEDHLDRLLLEALDEGLGAGELHGTVLLGGCAVAGGTGLDERDDSATWAEKAIDLPAAGGRERTRRVEPVRYRMSTRATSERRIRGSLPERAP